MKLFRQLKIFKDFARKDGLVVIINPFISGVVTCWIRLKVAFTLQSLCYG